MTIMTTCAVDCRPCVVCVCIYLGDLLATRCSWQLINLFPLVTTGWTHPVHARLRLPLSTPARLQHSLHGAVRQHMGHWCRSSVNATRLTNKPTDVTANVNTDELTSNQRNDTRNVLLASDKKNHNCSMTQQCKPLWHNSLTDNQTHN